MAITDEPRPPRLPLRRTLSAAYQSVLGQFDVLLHIAWPWLLVMLPFEIAHSWWSHPRIRALPGSDDAAKPPPDLLERLVDPVWTLLLVIPLSAIAVGWHRFLLRGEVPARATLAINGPILPYMGMALLFSVITYLPFLLPLEIDAMPEDDSFPTLIFAALAAFLVAFAVVSRLSVALPAIAIGGPGRTLAEAWRTTRRNTWKLVIGSLLAAVPLIAVAILSASLANHLDRIAFAVVGGVLEVVSALLITIGVAFLSFAWRHFYGASAAPLPPA